MILVCTSLKLQVLTIGAVCEVRTLLFRFQNGAHNTDTGLLLLLFTLVSDVALG